MTKSIAHPTDFSEASALAFAHALRMAIASRSRLLLLHVRASDKGSDWSSFPHVRAFLTSWGMLDANAAPRDIPARLGVQISKIEIHHDDPALGLFEFFLSHRPDVIVLSTHGREGLSRWLSGSVSEEVARQTHIPTLFFGPNARGFVDAATGEIRLQRILVPIAHSPSPALTLSVLSDVMESIGASRALVQPLHIGNEAPELRDMRSIPCSPVELVKGPVVSTILKTVHDRQMQLVAMPTAGHQGFLDTLRGSTTERVLRQAPCPVLAIGAYEHR